MWPIFIPSHWRLSASFEDSPEGGQSRMEGANLVATTLQMSDDIFIYEAHTVLDRKMSLVINVIHVLIYNL